ncbi:glycosyltransferase family 4 protein [Calothrix sp. PCC 6303]|uniref:glycosyltransferase family 4 protein n=1 Tax=Calothrix sp. PCC 6303 TaxID=1170562 RepID=UPI0002A019E0|nr:glycosyltransferase family 4 protein [Calothrix sp. PCC 6303]AFZ01835.1 glycosyl transferase group 1 [Calothrix sp. PCC 6303]
MRVLHLTNHIQEIGNGIVNVAMDIACLQAKSGHNVAVASAGGGYEKLLARYGIQHFPLDQSRMPLNMLKAVGRYRRIIHEFQPDIVHAHMMTGVILAGIFRTSSEYGLVSTVHNEFQRSAVLMGLADRVIAVSAAVANSMVRRGIPREKLRVVANGTLDSPRRCDIRDCEPVSLKRPAITTVAGMYSRKGIVELIEAFVKIGDDFPEAHLYLVGDGPERLDFEEIAQKTPFANRIHFEGFQTEPQRYMLSSDVFVLASHCESFGLVLTEAREAGCAIIASDVDGIPETLDNRQAGVLVPAKDSEVLAKAMSRLLSNPEELGEWKHRAKQNLERFSVMRVSDETLDVYCDLLKRSNGVSLVNRVSASKLSV